MCRVCTTWGTLMDRSVDKVGCRYYLLDQIPYVPLLIFCTGDVQRPAWRDKSSGRRRFNAVGQPPGPGQIQISTIFDRIMFNQVSWSSGPGSVFGQSSQAPGGPAWSGSCQGRSSNQFNQTSSLSNRGDGSRTYGSKTYESSSWSTRNDGSRTYRSQVKSQH